MVVYIDAMLLLNFIINYYLTCFTLRTLQLKVNNLRRAISVFIMTIYCLTILFNAFKVFSHFIFRVFIVIISFKILLGNCNFKLLLKAVLIFIGYGMLLAGVLIYLQLEALDDVYTNISVKGINLTTILFTIVIIQLSIKTLVYFIRDRFKVNDLIFEVIVYLNNNNFKLKAFYDTGNELKEHLTGLPVIIVANDIIPKCQEQQDIIYKISYSVINGHTGCLNGFKPLYAIIIDSSGMLQKRDVIIAAIERNAKLFDEYDGLLSRGVV